MNQQTSSNTYVTSDLALATTISLQFPIQDIDRSNPRKAVFVFLRSPELEELVEGYFRNALKISPQTFFNQLRDIKSRLYAERSLW
jgi:hypothetical protein